MKKTLVLFAVVLLLVGNAFDAFAGDVEKTLSHDISECARIVKRIAGSSKSGASNAEDIVRLKKCAEALNADQLLLVERHKTLSERAAALGGKASDRQEVVSSALIKNLAELLTLLDAIGANINSSDLETLQQLLDNIIPKRSRPLLGALPYKHSNYPPREPASSPQVKPAYKGGDRAVYAADTAVSPEAPLSKEIVDLAQSLQWNPVLIYEWVKNNVETEWYWGSMKGAEETLRQKSGNDADQAALLVALLRASNFPARYVRGTIDFFPDIERAKNLTGLDDPLKMADFFRKAGIPFKPVVSGGGISNFQIEHIWVEAFIPYANYRGAVVDDQGKIWLGLDTSIKPLGYTRHQGAGVPADLLAPLRDDYLNAVQTFTPLEYLTGKLDEQLALNQPGKTWNDLKDTAVLVPDVLKIIPDSMQFNQIAISGEYQSLPDELKHKLTFTATTGSSELFSITFDTHKLSSKRLALRAEPETVEDQNTIDSFGGLDNTPAYLVRLRPVLTIDGERMIVAQDGLPMGAEFALNIDVITPNGTERISSSQINGNLSVIGVIGQKALTPAAITEEDDAETILHKEAIGYIDRWNKGEDDLTALLGQRISRPTVTVATVGGQMEVTTLLDITHDMQWQGLYLDAGYRRIETTGRNGLEKEFLRLSALQGSILENRIFEDDLEVDSVSTAKLLQLAATGNTLKVSINKTNVEAVLPTLPFDDAVKSDIANAVNQGLTVTIPQSEVAFQDWSGIGYIKENLETGESGWMLSGQVAGGMTAWSGERYDSATLNALYATLKTTGVKPNKNPQAGAYIFKISATDQQIGVVGKALTTTLQVKVLDSTMRPVQGASVTFTVKAGGGTLSINGATKGTKYVATTNSGGIASITMTPGQITAVNPIYWTISGNIYSDQYGDNVIEAVLGTTGLSTTFNIFGAPGILSKLRPTHGMAMQGYFLSYAGFVGLMAEDLYGNPIANQKVTFKLGTTTISGSCKSKILDITKTTKGLLVKGGDACINSSPTISDAASCKSASSISIEDTTSISGTFAGVILGGAPGATYPVTASASAAGSTTLTAQYAPSTYDLISCSDNVEPMSQLVVSSLIAKDVYGNSINAARSGSAISIIAKQYLIKEVEATGTETFPCDTGAVSCPKVVGSHSFGTTTDFVASTALFDRIPAKDLGNGLFQGIYILKPGLNTITIEGLASIGFNHFANSCANGCATSPTTDVRTLGSATTVQAYGVDIAIKQPLNIMLNDQGISRNNLKISYTINPVDYQARDALILLYKVTDLNGKKNYEQIDYIPVENKGSGFGTIARGYRFDDTQNYAVSVALNYGTYVQIMSDPAPINFVTGALIPDYNHNRKIDDEDYDRALNDDPYYFWVNDDDGNGDTEGSGIPNTRNPSTIGVVNGTRDLVDYFPVQLDIKKVTSKYAPGAYTYRLKNADEALSLVLPWLPSADSGKYLTDMPTAQILANAPALRITAAGLVLDPSLLQVIKEGKDVVLLEGWKATENPLVLEISDAKGNQVFTSNLNLRIAGVEQMFRHVNLIQAINAPNAPPLMFGSGGEINRLSKDDFTNKEQFEGFDVQNDDKYFVLLHGVNVSGNDARGWHAEMFKRLYWAGSKAHFVGVSWFSTDGVSWGYYPNVIHAFETAEIFGPKLKVVVGNSPVTIMAHSLGNIVVSSYLVDQFQKPENQLNVNAYLMFDTAVALESYLGDYTGYGTKLDEELKAENPMVHTDWFGYQKRFSASEWYQRFAASDGRNKLTWRNRFSALPDSIKYVNFFSSGEDVLATYSGTQADLSDPAAVIDGRNSWVLQEKWKGLPSGMGGSDYMGWGFNKSDDQYNPETVDPDGVSLGRVRLTPLAANSEITDDGQLKSRPFFWNIGTPGVASILFTDAPVDFSTIKPDYNQLLTYAIPALTTATGGRSGGGMISKKNFVIIDMNLNLNVWPSSRPRKEWLHSDVKNVAFPFVLSVIDEIATKGGLK